MPAWNLVGESTYTKTAKPTQAWRLVGDVSTIVVPLAYPLPKQLELLVVFNGPAQIVVLWQALVAQAMHPDKAGYVEFPTSDDDLRDVYFPTDGPPFDKFPWETEPAADRPENWAALLYQWYFRQEYYGQRQLVEAFINAFNEVSDVPLGQRGASLQQFLDETPPTGAVVSVLKPASTSTPKKTAVKSGPRRTTSSRGASKA